jgi:uncharacterized protein YbbK (DUF523 family)
MEKIGVSACLLGIHCKYKGGHNLNLNVLKELIGKEVVLICPEVMGGLPTPRIPSEIQSDGHLINQNNENVTKAFDLGKHLSLKKLKENKVKKVILKDGSPSCGYKSIYDGSFSQKKIPGQGVTAQYLLSNNIEVLDIE